MRRGTFAPLTLRHLVAHKLRTLVTISGIAIGTAAVLAPQLLHNGVLRAYDHTATRLTGHTALQVTNGAAGVPEELLETLAQVTGVAAALPVVRGTLPLVGRPGESLYVFGPDLTAAGAEAAYDVVMLEDKLLFLSKADSIAVPPAFLTAMGATLGDHLEVLAPRGVTPLTIRARLAAARGPAVLFAGRLAVMDVWAAQRLFGLARRVTAIDIVAAPDVDPDALERAVRAAVDGRASVERPDTRSATLRGLLAGTRWALTITGTLAVLVGIYLVFNTMSISVAQRERELGTLRSLGMERRAIIRLVAREAVLLGALGGLAGVPLALGLAHVLSGGFAASVSAMYAPVDAPEITLGPVAAALSVLLGLTSALLAALLPARRAARLEPLLVMRPGSGADAPAEGYGRLAAGGVAVLLVAAGAWLAQGLVPLPVGVLGNVTATALVLGASLMAPAAVRAAAIAGEPLFGRCFGATGVLAGRTLVHDLRYVAVTAAAFVTAVASVVAIAGIVSSVEGTLRTWIGSAFRNVHLMVNAGDGLFTFEPPPLPGTFADEVATLPEVAHAEPLRFAKVPYQGGIAVLRATDTALFRGDGPRRLRFLGGDEDAALAAVAAGNAVVVNDAFARRFASGTGDTVALPTPDGALSLPIAGTFADFGDQAVVFLERAFYRRHWRDDSLSFVNVTLRPGADPTAVATAIRARWGEQYRLMVLATDDFRREQEALIGQVAGATYPMIAIGIAVALLGIMNSLVAMVLHRERMIGALRAAGATRRQVARIFVLQSALAGLGAALLATAVGLVLGYCEVTTILPSLMNIAADYHVPAAGAVFTLLVTPVLALLAGLIPARRAARFDVTAALHDV